jgi:hypothetical protein
MSPPTRPGEHAPRELGYADFRYACALGDLGVALPLPASGGALLRRPIAGTELADGIGPYPLFACRDWSRLAGDLASLDTELVSVTAVSDPFGEFTPAELARAFPDRVMPYKEHFVVDLHRVSQATLAPHHRRNSRWAARHVEVVRRADLLRELDSWERLYAELRGRHAITGAACFSRESFARQLALPGMVAFQALAAGEVVGMMLWLCRDEVAYYHLGAYSAQGYAAKASFALVAAAIGSFAGERRWLALGAGAGAAGDASDGLSRFKAGWATDRRTVYLCGRIGQPGAYAALARRCGGPRGDWFPAYRASG